MEGQSAGLISVSKFLLKGKSRRKKRKGRTFVERVKGIVENMKQVKYRLYRSNRFGFPRGIRVEKDGSTEKRMRK